MTECSQDTHIAINDTQFENRLICRSFEYYINHNSDSIIELGTIDYPYKELSYALIEVLNYHSHTDHNITIHLMEETSNILGFRQANIVNITNVSIVPYSLSNPNPEKATILVKDEIEVISTPSTLFNVMKTFEMRMNEVIFNNSDITEQERLRVEFNDYNIMILRSNFMIQNMNVISDREDLFNDVSLLFFVYIQDKTITLKDMHLSVSGTLSMTYDPISMNLINLDVDYYRNLGGFEMEVVCNYPEAELDTTIFVDNITFYYGSDRAVVPVRKQLLTNQQPGNFIVNNYHSEIYLTRTEPYGLLVLYLTYD